MALFVAAIGWKIKKVKQEEETVVLHHGEMAP